MLKRTIIILISTLAAGTVLAQAYKWVDEDGVVHYSDRPHVGAERVQLPSDGNRPRPAPPPVRSNAAGDAGDADDAAEDSTAFRYEALTIGAPLAEETLWNIEGVLNVTLNLQPALQTGPSHSGLFRRYAEDGKSHAFSDRRSLTAACTTFRRRSSTNRAP